MLQERIQGARTQLEQQEAELCGHSVAKQAYRPRDRWREFAKLSMPAQPQAGGGKRLLALLLQTGEDLQVKAQSELSGAHALSLND